MRRFKVMTRGLLAAAFVAGAVGVNAPGTIDAVACDASVVFVAGSSPAPSGDRSLLEAVEAWSPGCVTVVDDDAITMSAAEAADVVVIASSVVPNTLGDRLVDAAVPILVSEPFLFDEMAMTAGNGKELAGRTAVRITDPSHPLAGGLSGSVTVFTAPARLNYGLDGVAPGVEPVANTGGGSARQTIFGFAAGAALTDRVAPAGRVGFFPSFRAELTADGETLVRAALDWLGASGPDVQCGSVITWDLVLEQDLLDCPGPGLVVGADDITIDLNGHTIAGSEAGRTAGEEGIDLGHADGVTVRNGTIRDFFYGIEAFGDRNVLEDLTFTDNAASIEFVTAHDNVVRRNRSAAGGSHFVRMTHSNRNVVEDNVSMDSRWGVIVSNGDHNEVASNELSKRWGGGVTGVLVDAGSSGTTVRTNEIEGFEFGILIGDATDTTVQGNTATDNDIDGIRVEADAAGTAVGGNTADDNGEWGIRALAVVDDTGGNSATGNGVGQCQGVDCAMVPPPRGLLVAGNTSPPAGDRDIVGVIEDAGVLVTIVDDDSDLAAIDTSLYDVVFISTSVVPDKVGDTFRTASVPVIVWEGYLFDDMGLTASGETNRTHRNVTIVDPNDPLTAGLPIGDHRVYRDLAPLSYGTPSPAARVIAHEPSRPDHAVIFSYDAGDELVDGSSAAALRLGLFMSYPGGLTLTETGRQLIAAGIDWTLAGGPSGNDDFADRFTLDTDTADGDNINATTEPDEEGMYWTGSSVWWEWTATIDGAAVVETAGSDFDTVLAAWSGTELATLTRLAVDDDGGPGLTSRLVFSTRAGETYQLAVYGYEGAQGHYQLAVSEIATPVNDDFDAAAVFSGESAAGSNLGATFEPGEPLPEPYEWNLDVSGSVWWTWTAPRDGRFVFGTTFDQPPLAVWQGSDVDALTLIAAHDTWGDSVVEVDASAGETYRVAVYATPNSSGDVHLNLRSDLPRRDQVVATGWGSVHFELDGDGYPVLAYQDDNTGAATLMHCDDVECDGANEAVNVVDPEAEYLVGLALDTAGTPVVGIGNGTAPGALGLVNCNDPDCAGGDERVSSVQPTTIDIYPERGTLELDDADHPVLLVSEFSPSPFFDYQADHLVRCNDPDCSGSDESSVQIAFVDPSPTGVSNSFAINGDDHPLLVRTPGVTVVGCDDPTCEGGAFGEPSTSIPVGGAPSSIVLDADGFPVIGFANGDGPGVIMCNDTACAGGDETVVSIATAPYWASSVHAARDASGNPVLAWVERGAGDLVRLARFSDPAGAADPAIIDIDFDIGGDYGLDTAVVGLGVDPGSDAVTVAYRFQNDDGVDDIKVFRHVPA